MLTSSQLDELKSIRQLATFQVFLDRHKLNSAWQDFLKQGTNAELRVMEAVRKWYFTEATNAGFANWLEQRSLTKAFEIFRLSNRSLDLDTVMAQFKAKVEVAPKPDVPDTPKGVARRIFSRHADGNLVLEIDNTSLSSFNSCARAAEFRLVRGRGSNSSPATRYGSAIHLYLEKRLCGVQLKDAMQEMINLFKTYPPVMPDEWRTVDHAINAMTQYEAFYAQRSSLRVLKDDQGSPLVEIPFCIPLTTVDVNATFPWPASMLVNGETSGDHLKVGKVYVYWTGKIDALVEDNTGGGPLDHKTTSMLGPSFYKDFELSQQMIGYLWATRKVFLDRFSGVPRRVTIDVIAGRKPTKTGVAHEFAREHFTYSDAQLEEWEANTKHLVADFLSHLLRGYFPMQTNWCVAKYGVCPYHEVCTMSPSHRLGHLERSYEPMTWSPLHPTKD
jgi:hypothetical protein